jgi:hypothetical protein
MQSKDYFKNKARKLAKQTWAGPGKFGVFIVICIIIIATFESLGLSNREKNLELRTVQNIVIPINNNQEKVTIEMNEHISESFTEKLKLSAQLEFEKKNSERENILLFGAMDQYLFEHENYVKHLDNMNSVQEKTKHFITLLLNELELPEENEVNIDSEDDDTFILDI